MFIIAKCHHHCFAFIAIVIIIVIIIIVLLVSIGTIIEIATCSYRLSFIRPSIKY